LTVRASPIDTFPSEIETHFLRSTHVGFLRAVSEGLPVQVSVEDGLKAVVIGLAAEKSIREKRIVEIDGLSLV